MNLNGGSNAIRGFNYQKAIITLISVLNYQKENFYILVENKEDAEVVLEKTHTFIQVKGKKLGISSLTKVEKGTSILSKNLSHESSKKTRYKIVTFEPFTEKDKKKLILSKANLIFDEIYEYSDEQKKHIIERIKNQGLTETQLICRLSESYIYFSPFKKLEQAIPFIIGKMTENGINVDNNKGDVSINEIFKLIDIKSEVLIDSENEENPNKKLTANELKSVFKTSRLFSLEEEVWGKIKDQFNLMSQKQIEQEQVKILSFYQELKISIKAALGSFSVNEKIKPLSNNLYEKVKDLGNKSTIYAILIGIIAERMQKELKC